MIQNQSLFAGMNDVIEIFNPYDRHGKLKIENAGFVESMATALAKTSNTLIVPNWVKQGNKLARANINKLSSEELKKRRTFTAWQETIKGIPGLDDLFLEESKDPFGRTVIEGEELEQDDYFDMYVSVDKFPTYHGKTLKYFRPDKDGDLEEVEIIDSKGKEADKKIVMTRSDRFIFNDLLSVERKRIIDEDYGGPVEFKSDFFGEKEDARKEIQFIEKEAKAMAIERFYLSHFDHGFEDALEEGRQLNIKDEGIVFK